jgi:hypothetical protein
MPTVKAKFEKALQDAGGEVDFEYLSEDQLVIDLPAGRCWNANGSHSLHYGVWDNGERAWETEMNEAYRFATEDILLGADKCLETRCDICEGN